MKAIPKGNKGLAKLPKAVRNKMGYMKRGGAVKKMNTGGVSTTKPKPRPNTNKSGNPSFRDRSKNEKALEMIKKLKPLKEKDFKKAQNFILNMIEKKNK